MIAVEIWSDVVCPWCYIGKRRFEAALAAFERRDEVEVTWRAFELDPTAPRTRDADGATHLAGKYGVSREEALAMLQRMTDTAAEDGLELRFDRAQAGNTFDAHRLLHLARERGIQDAVKERFMRGYLTDGAPIGEPAALQRLAEEAGLDAEEVREVLATDRYAEEVRADEELGAGFGIQGVPFFVVDRRVAASGAQPPEQLLELLRRADPAIAVVAGGDACGPEGC